MSKHKDKDRERSRDERRSRERDRSRDRDHRKRSRDRSKERRSHKKSKDKDRSRRSRSRKSSRRDRSRDRSRSRERSRRSRSRESRRSRSRSTHRRRSITPVKPVDVTPAQHVQISQLIMSSLTANLSQSVNPTSQTSILGQPPALLQQPVRTDFSNLFHSSTTTTKSSEVTTVSTNTSAMAIAAAKARELLKAKNLNINEKSSDNATASNGNNNSNNDDEFRAMLNALGDNSSGGVGDASNTSDGTGERRRKKKSRWASTNDGTEGKTFIPGMPTILPSNLNADQQEAYLVQLQIEEISRKLRTGDLGISMNLEERSPSPEPIYSSDGKRLNTREFRTRKKLEDQRHMLITRMQCMNPEFKPPSDYKPPVTRVSDKVLIPQEEHPDINFVGLLIGPRGNTLKAMEKETGAKIIIRGKGSVKEGKVGRKDGQPLPGEDEPLHAFITASTLESVKKAVDKIKEVIRQGIEVPEGSNDLRRMQLRELALLNGTLRETDGMRCSNCGSSEHKSWLCPDKPNVTNNIVCSACGGAGHISKDCKSKRPGLGGVEGSNNQAKIDEEYMSLMAELGEVQPQEILAKEPQQPQSKPYNIFDNPRHQPAPRPLCPPPVPAAPPIPSNNFPPMSGPPPPWQIPNPAPIPQHPMGQYPPMNQWGPPIPPPPFPGPQMNQPPPPVAPPPPGTDLCPPGTSAPNSWANPPLPPGNYWETSTNFLPPPPPPE